MLSKSLYRPYCTNRFCRKDTHVVLVGEDLERGLNDTTTETEDEVEGRLLLDVCRCQIAPGSSACDASLHAHRVGFSRLPDCASLHGLCFLPVDLPLQQPRPLPSRRTPLTAPTRGSSWQAPRNGFRHLGPKYGCHWADPPACSDTPRPRSPLPSVPDPAAPKARTRKPNGNP